MHKKERKKNLILIKNYILYNLIKTFKIYNKKISFSLINEY